MDKNIEGKGLGEPVRERWCSHRPHREDAVELTLKRVREGAVRA